MKSVLCIFLYLIHVACTQGDTTCVQSQCMSIYQCEPLLELLKKTDRTSEDIETLKKSQCGVEDKTPLVCCPNQCFTPERNPGYCINIYQCPTLSNLLTPPISNKTKALFETFRCDGSDEFSVCCSYYSNPAAVKPTQNCELTAIPPDPRTECCGLEVNGAYRTYEGSRTKIDMYPWLAALEYQDKNNTLILCGGALISAKYLLTTARCVVYDKPTKVRLGEYDTANDGPDCVIAEEGGLQCTEGAVSIPIELIIPHPEYSYVKRTKRNDIALIRMSEKAPYTDFIRPICLPSIDRTMDPPKEFMMFVAGWGAVNLTTSSSNAKRHVGLPFNTLESCKLLYDTERLTLWRGQLCAGGIEGQDTCQGDSGTPLVYQSVRSWKLIGITSFGKGCGLEGVPGVYTNVFQYIPWINSQIIS